MDRIQTPARDTRQIMEHITGPMSLFAYGHAENLAIGVLAISFACAVRMTLSALNQAIDRMSARQPLLLEGSRGEHGMFRDLRKYDWVLEVHRYDGLKGLLTSLGDRVIAPAEAKVNELEKRRP